MTNSMTVHPLKTWPAYFEAIQDGRKRFEVRRNDRWFDVGDLLALLEFDPEAQEYTGRVVWVRVTYMLKGDTMPPGLVCPGTVIMGIDVCSSIGAAFSCEKNGGHCE